MAKSPLSPAEATSSSANQHRGWCKVLLPRCRGYTWRRLENRSVCEWSSADPESRHSFVYFVQQSKLNLYPSFFFFFESNSCLSRLKDFLVLCADESEKGPAVIMITLCLPKSLCSWAVHKPQCFLKKEVIHTPHIISYRYIHEASGGACTTLRSDS